MKKIYLLLFNNLCGTRSEIQNFCEAVGSYWYAPFPNCIFFSSTSDVNTLSLKFDFWFSVDQKNKKMYMIMECDGEKRGTMPSDLVKFIENPDDPRFS